MRVPVGLLATLMLLTGSINTIATKIQDGVVVGTDAEGKPLLFKHPAVQTAFMFAGEALCLIPFFLHQWLKTDDEDSQALAFRHSGPNDNKAAHFRSTALAFTVPALCDAGATTLLNLGLYYTYASVFQMLRGTLVVFAGILTIILLKRRLRSHNWFGMVLITAGAALVGASSIVYESKDAESGGEPRRAAANPLLGNLLVIFAQLLNAAQFILEEKFLRQLHPPVLLAVGIEGVVGMILCAIAVPLLSHIPGPGGGPIDDAAAGIKALSGNTTLQYTTVLTVLSIAAFNFCGVSVTKRLSGASRAAIDACRTAVVWLYCLNAGWERFHMLQVVGFVILITGTSVYNDILRSFMPAPPRIPHSPGRHRHRRHSQRHQRGATEQGDGGGGLESVEQPLLAGEGGSDGDEEEGAGGRGGGTSVLQKVTIEAEDGKYSTSPASAAASGGKVGSPLVGIAPTNPEEISPQESPLPPRPPGARAGRGRSAAISTYTYSGGAPITMARSVTMMPGALSPHSLASVPSDMLLLESVYSDMNLESYREGGMYDTGLSSESEEGSEGSEMEEEFGKGDDDSGGDENNKNT